MTTPAIFNRSVIFLILSLHQIFTLQVPDNYLTQNAFRIPRASKLRKYINESIDPCSDFYEFACGNWETYHPATEDTPITSPIIDLEDSVNKELQVILEENVTREDGLVGRKIKDFYASCMDSEAASQSMKQVFLEFVNNSLGMPAVLDRFDERRYNWITVISNLRKEYGMDILIGLNIKPNFNDRQISRIYIGEPSTLLPKSICKEGDSSNSQYIELQTEITDNMAYWFDLDKTEGSQFALELLEFETNLCRGMSEELGPNSVPNITRKYLHHLDAIFPSIKFTDFVTTSLGMPISDRINLQDEAYFHHLPKIIRSTSKKVIANYIMYRALNTISFPAENDKEKRAVLCVEMCMKHFPKVLGDMFNRKNSLSKKEKDVDQLWRRLKAAFEADIANQLWIEENTRRLAIYKINGMELIFPNYLRDFLFNEYGSVNIELNNFWQNILNLLQLQQNYEKNKLYDMDVVKDVESFNINVEYRPIQNKIQMPLGLLQPQIYHRTAPFAYKYGVLGYLIARELIHGFDEIGWNFHNDSAMRPWWDQSSIDQYKERAACFRDQYVNYAGEDSGLSPLELDEKVREIIADNGALNISFNAYLQLLEDINELDILYSETFSDVDFTNTQLFFISFAQNFCTSVYSKEPPIGFFPWDVTNYLEKFKVNGLLWNMKEFSREFNCLPGTEMNPGDKCTIF